MVQSFCVLIKPVQNTHTYIYIYIFTHIYIYIYIYIHIYIYTYIYIWNYMKHLWNSWPIPTHLVARCLSCWVCGGTFAPPSRHRSGCSRTWRRNGGTWRWIWGSRFPVTVHYTVDTCCWLNIRVYVCVAIYHDHSLSQWEFQDPKMEVLYHIRQYFMGIFPYIGLIYIYICVC